MPQVQGQRGLQWEPLSQKIMNKSRYCLRQSQVGNVSQRNEIFQIRLHLGSRPKLPTAPQLGLRHQSALRSSAPPQQGGCACAHWPRPLAPATPSPLPSVLPPACQSSFSLRPSRREEPACVSRSSPRKPADSGVRTRTSAALKRGGRPLRADVLAGSRLRAMRRRSRRKVGPP